MHKPCILIIMPYYLPGQRAGGPVRSIANLVSWLGDDYNFYILTSNHDFGVMTLYPYIESGTWQSVGKAKIRYLTASEWGLTNLTKIISSVDYDILYVDAIFAFSAIRAVILYRLGMIQRKPLVIVPRGQLNIGAMRLRRNKKKLYLYFAHYFGLYRNVLWHASNDTECSDILREIAAARAERIHIASNLPSPSLEIAQRDAPNKVSGQLRVVFLSRIVRKKNLHFALKSLQSIRGNVQFDIYGFIEDTGYWADCQTIIQQLTANIQVHYKGEVDFDKVAAILRAYHVFYLPTLGENFGHVILEALCAGCPVLLSDQTPWQDIAEHGVGWAFPLDQPDDFVSTLQALVDMLQDEFSRIAHHAAYYGKRYIQHSSHIDQTRRMFNIILERQ